MIAALRTVARALVVFALVTVVRPVRAQEHSVVPPEARSVGVEYPKGAHGDAVVVLELFIGGDGHVIEARVLAGAEPFLGAARAAAPSFTFEAATIDGRRVAARIRVEIPFRDTIVVPPPHFDTIEVAPVNRPPPHAPAITGVEDVHVRGVRKELGGTAMSKEEVRDMPGAFGDAFRAIDMMPGVVPIISGLPYFFVRGAPPGNTGYFLDSVRVPLLYHLALGPSVVHPSLIDRVDFYPGGFPAEYGRYTGGIVAGETRGASARLTAEGELRLFDVGVLGETPFANGKGDALVSGRYGYPALLVTLFAPTTQLSYWDYQARLSYRVAPRDTLTAFVFGSFDELDQRQGTTGADGNTTYGSFFPLVRTEFHRVDLRWDHAIRGGRVRTALTLGLDDSLAGGGDSNNNTERVQATSVQLRTELDQQLRKDLRVRAGADVLLYHYDYTETFPSPVDPLGPPEVIGFPSRNDVIFGGHGDVVWNVHPRVEVVPGLRFDVFTSRSAGTLPPRSILSIVTGDKATAAPALDPRLAARVTVTPRFSWVGTFGVTHQPPSFVAPIPGGELGSLSQGLQSAVQASQGFEAKLPWNLELKSTFFIQRYFGLTNALASCTTSNDLPGLSCLGERSQGRGIGLEVLLRRSFSKRIGGWISYTFSRSTVEVPHPSRNEPSEILSNFDRTHVLNTALAFDFGKGYHAGARFTYYTGLPYTVTYREQLLAPYNGYRLPDYWRIDVRLEKRWRLGPHGQFAIVLEGLNITFNKEAIAAQRCDQPRAPCTAQTIGPVSVPSLGVEAKY